MPVHERTYSFRGSEDLAERTRNAFETWSALLAETSAWSESSDAASQQLWLVFVKQYMLASRDVGDSQSARLRSLTETFVSAAESVAANRAHVDAYKDWAEEDTEANAAREGALAAAAARWRDE